MAIRIMDEATKAKLKGLLPFAPGSTISVTLPVFEKMPEDQQPKFFLRDFGPKAFYQCRAESKIGNVSHETKIKSLRGEFDGDPILAGWEDVPDNLFNEIPYSLDAISKLPFQWVEWLYWRAFTLCSPGEPEKEGLDSSPPPASASSSKAVDAAEVAKP